STTALFVAINPSSIYWFFFPETYIKKAFISSNRSLQNKSVWSPSLQIKYLPTPAFDNQTVTSSMAYIRESFPLLISQIVFGTRHLAGVNITLSYTTLG